MLTSEFICSRAVYHKPQTVAYKIKVDRVLRGDFSVGDVVTVEDYYFVLDSVVSIKKGDPSLKTLTQDMVFCIGLESTKERYIGK